LRALNRRYRLLSRHRSKLLFQSLYALGVSFIVFLLMAALLDDPLLGLLTSLAGFVYVMAFLRLCTHAKPLRMTLTPT